MRIIIANCSVTYSGRGETSLPKNVRAIIIKDDGAVSIHSDASNKPLNYMPANSNLIITNRGRQQVWLFKNKKEQIEIKISRIISDDTFILSALEPGLKRQRTEHHLQAHLAAKPELFGYGWSLVGREFPTGAGPVDLFMKDPQGVYWAVEVKRTAMLGAVDQCSRYVEALNAGGKYGEVRGMVAALDIRPNTVKLAESRGIWCLTVMLD